MNIKVSESAYTVMIDITCKTRSMVGSNNIASYLRANSRDGVVIRGDFAIEAALTSWG